MQVATTDDEMETATREDRPDTEGPMRAQRDDAAEGIPAEPAQAPTSEPAYSETDAGTTLWMSHLRNLPSRALPRRRRRPSPTDQTLFADGELTDMRSRWTEVQSAFVDDPRDCVQKADGLVADVVDKLTAGFSGARCAARGAVEPAARRSRRRTSVSRCSGTATSSSGCSRSESWANGAC